MWSIACMAKFQVMNSTMGFSPAKAAPTPTPAKPCSVMGVSTTRWAPNSSSKPLRDLVGALVFADLLAHEEHGRVAPHLLGHGVAQRLAHGHADHLGPGRNLGLGARLGGRACGPPAPARPEAGLRRDRARAPPARSDGRSALAPAGRPQGDGPRHRAAARCAASRGMRPPPGVLAVGEEHGDRRDSPSRARCPPAPGSCRAARRRPPRPPWSPCRSRSRR